MLQKIRDKITGWVAGVIIIILGIVFVFWCGASLVGGLVYGAMHRRLSPILLLLAMAALTLSGMSSNAVPAGMPPSGSPSAGS